MRAAERSGACRRGTYIRVNQVGYPTTAPKRAYLLSPRVESGATFSVVQVPDGATVFTGTIGGSLGSWSRRYGMSTHCDFDAAADPGTYASRWRSLSRPISPPLRSQPGAVLYESPLSNGLSLL